MKVAEESTLVINEAYLLVLGREVDEEGMHHAARLVNQDENGLVNLYRMLLRSHEFSLVRVHNQKFSYGNGVHEEEQLRILVKAIYHFFLERDLVYDSENYVISEIIDKGIDIRSFITKVIGSEEYCSLLRLRASDKASNETIKKQISALLEETVNSGVFDLISVTCSDAAISYLSAEFASFISEFMQKRRCRHRTGNGI